MEHRHLLAGRLRLLADRLDADGSFGGMIVARDCREAADYLDSDADGGYNEGLDWLKGRG